MTARGTGHAAARLHQAALIISYYGRTNPEFVSLARRTVEKVLADV
jgi:hypothetical protein